jgi:hypothetical protein
MTGFSPLVVVRNEIRIAKMQADHVVSSLTCAVNLSLSTPLDDIRDRNGTWARKERKQKSKQVKQCCHSE